MTGAIKAKLRDRELELLSICAQNDAFMASPKNQANNWKKCEEKSPIPYNKKS